MNSPKRLSTSQSDLLHELIRAGFNEQSLVKAVLSKPRSKNQAEGSRVDIRPVTIRQERFYQFAVRINNQEKHRNLKADDAAEEILRLAGTDFLDCFLRTQSDEWTARFRRSGDCRIQHKQVSGNPEPSPASHDNQRQYLLPEGKPIPFLIETGIMTAEGKVRAKHFHKFRQINRYAEFIAEVVDHLPQDDVIRVVDFGCGKSYLTFATHYLLSKVLSRKTEIVGLDRRKDVVDTCRQITENLHLAGLSFHQGDIASWRPQEKINLAISLHACDTATDAALAMAASWEADVIFAAPCCQHELSQALPRDQFPVLSQHGILHERFAALATDAVRASLMERIGYRTQVMEFIDLEHTPKNLLIRCVRRKKETSESSQKEISEPMPAISTGSKLPELQLERKLKEYKLLPSAGAVLFDKPVVNEAKPVN